jgi:phage recombination protein Bet
MSEQSTKLSVINERAELEAAPERAEQMKLIREAAGGAALNDKQFAILVEIARRTGLDIMRKQIYGVAYGGKMSVIVGIDGLRAIARRNGLAGVSDATYTYKADDTEERWPVTATVTVKRAGPAGLEEYTSTARWKEFACYRNKQPDGQWAIRPHVMLAKCAEAQALRKGFAESLGGLYSPEEMRREEPTSMRVQQGARKIEDVVAPKQEQHDDVTGEVYDGPPDGEGFYPEE